LLEELDATDWDFGAVRGQDVERIKFSCPPVRLLCPVCDDIEAANLTGGIFPSNTVSLGKPGEQVFSFSLQCQRCKNSVIVLLVRRIGRKITLVGRSEFEEVKPPQYIPKAQRQFYSQAVIAFQSKQTLAALFLLRTLIEQHMRAATGNSELRGDELCELYASKLDKDFNSRFPSLKVAYGKLSEALHRADPDEALFEAELKDMCLHFEGKELFERAAKSKR
jgi:hypothetical protein